MFVALFGFGEDVMIGEPAMLVGENIMLLLCEPKLDPEVDGIDASDMLSRRDGCVDKFTDALLFMLFVVESGT